MTTYTGSIQINAPAATVAGLLHDLPGWTSWTTTIVEATPLGAADMSPGTRVRVRQPGLPVSVWTVDRADDDGLEWNNLRHGLRTVATHRLSPSGTGCRLTVEHRAGRHAGRAGARAARPADPPPPRRDDGTDQGGGGVCGCSGAGRQPLAGPAAEPLRLPLRGGVVPVRLKPVRGGLSLIGMSAARTEPLDLDVGRRHAETDQQLSGRLGENR